MPVDLLFSVDCMGRFFWGFRGLHDILHEGIGAKAGLKIGVADK